MIKFFKNQDIIVNKFVTTKEQTLNNIILDLILGTDASLENTFPIILPVEQCDDIYSGSCKPKINKDTHLANTDFSDDNIPEFSIGKYVFSGSVFYVSGSSEWREDTNPLNINGTYKRQVYNTIKRMHYNNYNNVYNIFGFNQLNIDNQNLNLCNEFSLYSLKVNQAGDSIRPNTIRIINQTGDILSDIFDDGHNNLFLTGSHFINKYEFDTNTTSSIKNSGVCGLGYYLDNV